MVAQTFRNYDSLGRGALFMLTHPAVMLLFGVLLGFLSGLGVGGGSLLMLLLTLGLGLEYNYDHKFFGRIGYSHENMYKGNRRYMTFGAGFHLSIFSLDFSYTLATAATNPLDQTMRFTVGFDLAGIKDLVNNRR